MSVSQIENHLKSVAYWLDMIRYQQFSSDSAAYLYVHCSLLLDELKEELNHAK